MIQIAQPFQNFVDVNGLPLDNGYVYIGTAGQNPETNAIAVYWDAALTIPAAQPIRTLNGYLARNGSPSRLYANASSYSITVRDQNHVISITALDASTLDNLRADLAASTGSSLSGHIASEAGAIATTVQEKLRETLNAVSDYGVDNTGATNASTALKAFFDACIASGKRGHIPAGTYLITAGVLVFDNGFVDTAWPDISTDGYGAVTFKRADTTDAPLLTISNGTASSGAGNYWSGGSLGGITFDQNGKATASNQHGLSIRGIYGTKFGWMRAEDLGGSCIVLPALLFGGTNPDPYAITFCTFEGIEANRCLRYALENNNYVGLNGCVIKYLRAINTTLGGWYGLGAANRCDIVSMGSCGGWAFDDGTASASTGGSPSRTMIGLAELDDVENGIRLNKMTIFEAQQIRLIARYNFSSLNPAGGYWPRIGISISGGTAPAVTNVKINVIWRIEAGGTEPDLGVFTNMHSVASTDIQITNTVLDNAAFGIDDTALYSGFSTSSSSVFWRSGKLINDSRIKPCALVRSATSVTVPNSGYGAAGSKIEFATALSDRGSNYSTADSWFTVPFTGLYRVSGRISLAVAVGTLVRLGFATDIGGVVTTALNSYRYQVTANAESYEISGIVSLTVGHRLYLQAQQSTGGAVNLSAPISATADLTWSVESV